MFETFGAQNIPEVLFLRSYAKMFLLILFSMHFLA